jgi:hypothetical protein
MVRKQDAKGATTIYGQNLWFITTNSSYLQHENRHPQKTVGDYKKQIDISTTILKKARPLAHSPILSNIFIKRLMIH